jgi:hypothetical protein
MAGLRRQAPYRVRKAKIPSGGSVVALSGRGALASRIGLRTSEKVQEKGSNEKPCPGLGQGFSADSDWGFRARDAASTTQNYRLHNQEATASPRGICSLILGPEIPSIGMSADIGKGSKRENGAGLRSRTENSTGLTVKS